MTPMQPSEKEYRGWNEGINALGSPRQIVPPVFPEAVPLARPKVDPSTYNAERENHVQQPVQSSQQASAPLFRISFVGPDQQWYSVSANIANNQITAVPASPADGKIIDRSKRFTAAPPRLISDAHPAVARQAAPVWQNAAYPPASAWAHAAYPPAPAVFEETTRPMESAPPAPAENSADTSRDFLLQIVQPGLAGLMDGSVSTLAPIFAVAFATHQPFTVFLVGMASALGAGISMTFSEALSDDGEITGRGKPFVRGGVTGLMTFLSGAGHALPFLIPNIQIALLAAYAVVAFELLGIAAIRHKFFGTNWLLSIVQVVGGGILVFIAALLLGNA